jgi:type IV secretory pathway VirB9-like protein
MKVFYLAIALLVASLPVMAGSHPRTQICDFDGENADKVYKITTIPGVGTTFRLPEGWKISDFVVTDSKSFHAESNGTIGIVTPLLPNKSTSVSIYTDNDRLFVFHITSEADASGFVDQLVIVQCSNLQFFNNKVRIEAQKVAQSRLEAAEVRCNVSLEQKEQMVKERLLFVINSDYEIIGRQFPIERVADDGILTYIRIPKSQDRPLIYIGEKNDQKTLEPVKFTDEGEYYVVHRVLPPGDKHFFVKLGDRVSEIRRKH